MMRGVLRLAPVITGVAGIVAVIAASSDWADAGRWRLAGWALAALFTGWLWWYRSGGRALGLALAWVLALTLLVHSSGGMRLAALGGPAYVPGALGLAFWDGRLPVYVLFHAWAVTGGLYLVVSQAWGRWRSGGTGFAAVVVLLAHLLQAPVLDRVLEARTWPSALPQAPWQHFAGVTTLALLQLLGLLVIDALSVSPEERRPQAARLTAQVLAVLVVADVGLAWLIGAWPAAVAGTALLVYLGRSALGGGAGVGR